ncbi:MAG: STAS domain-containing protein [Myxococcales bacterium]|nr:STAS domain-containing protein [Myxococcales bacterium]
MRCERCCLEDPASESLDLDSYCRKITACTECPLQQGTATISRDVLIGNIRRLTESARQNRQQQNRIRQLERAQQELTEDIQRSDERVAKLEQTQKATTHAADEQLRAQLERLSAQQAAIMALATPIIQVWDGVLVLPLIGELDEERMQALTESLLSALQERRARLAVLDLTGVPTLNQSSAQHLYRIATAVRLLGAEALLCGLRSQVVQTVTSLGVDLSSLATTRSLQDALRRCIFPSRELPRV